MSVKLQAAVDAMRSEDINGLYDIEVAESIRVYPRGTKSRLLLELAISASPSDGKPSFSVVSHRCEEWTKRYRGNQVRLDWIRGFLRANAGLASLAIDLDRQQKAREKEAAALELIAASERKKRALEAEEQKAAAEAAEAQAEKEAEINHHQLVEQNRRVMEENERAGLQYQDDKKYDPYSKLRLRKNPLWDWPYSLGRNVGHYNE